MIIRYPENLNWKNPSPTKPSGTNIIDEFNYLIKNKRVTITIFIPIYLLLTYALYKDKIINLAKYLKSTVKR